MKFKLQTSGNLYADSKQGKLKKLGFTFQKPSFVDGPFGVINGTPEVVIESLEDLMTFAKSWGQIVITDDPAPTLEIYDRRRE